MVIEVTREGIEPNVAAIFKMILPRHVRIT